MPPASRKPVSPSPRNLPWPSILPPMWPALSPASVWNSWEELVLLRTTPLRNIIGIAKLVSLRVSFVTWKEVG